jgi:hypothetical protein
VTGEENLLVTALARTTDDMGGATARSRILTALGRHAEALDVARASPFASELAAAVEGLAQVRDAGEAALLLGTAVALRGMAVTGDLLAAATAARAAADLGAEGFAAAYAEGARQSRAAADSTVSRLSTG